MSKTRRPSPRKRTASSTRRKPAPKRPSRPLTKRRKAEPLSGYRVELKPILASIETAVAALRGMSPTEGIKLTVERLERCSFEMNAICANGDCGPDMAFPPQQ